MEKNDFKCSITANVSAEETIKKISNVPEWWGVAFTGSAEKKGDQFIIKMGGDSFFNFTVTELIPGKKVVWLVTDCNMPWYSDKKEWAGTKLIFEIAEENGELTLTFTHEGLTPDVECYKDCEPGWTHWIRTSLLSYLTTGKGKLKTRKNVSYSTGITVPFSAGIVFRCINDISKWWPEDFEGESAGLNDEFTFRSGEMHFSKQQIIEFVPDVKVVWLTTDSLRKTDNFVWTGAKYIFELTPTDDATKINFTYEGPVLENEYDRLQELCDMVIREKLYNFITTGKTV